MKYDIDLIKTIVSYNIDNVDFKDNIYINVEKNKNQWKARTSQNAVVVFDKVEGQNIGDFVTVFVNNCTQGTLLGKTI